MIFRTNNRHARGLQPAGLRRGFTLLELALVLTLIVLVAAVSWPHLEGWFQGHRLRQGVDIVRTHWVRARTLAMEEGRAYRFAWQPGGNQYRLAPADPEYWGEMGESAPVLTYSSGTPGLEVDDVLPEGVSFLGQGLGRDAAWSEEIVLFWPDGTARIFSADGLEKSDMYVHLTDAKGQAMALRLRGLTGVVTVISNRELIPR